MILKKFIVFTRHLSRHSVSEVRNINDEKSIVYDGVRTVEEPAVYCLFCMGKSANEPIYGGSNYVHVHQELKKVDVSMRNTLTDANCSHPAHRQSNIKAGDYG